MNKKQNELNTEKHENLLTISEMQNFSDKNLHYVLEIMEDLADWLIDSGTGYTEFSAALKPIFFNRAILKLETLKQKKTDSALSLLSGLNRRDIHTLRQQYGEYVHLKEITNDILLTSVPARVIGLWCNSKLPHSITFSEFENLVNSISSEKHPRSILSELKRLRLVLEIDNLIILDTNSFTPSPEAEEIKELFTANVKGHINAGLHNIIHQKNLFLEQALVADELTEKSVHILKQLSYELWLDFSQKIFDKAIECSKEDEGRRDAINVFKVGIYQFDDSTFNN